MSSLWTDLLFLHGHIANAYLARRLTKPSAPAPKPHARVSAKASPSPVGEDVQTRALVSPCGRACSPT